MPAAVINIDDTEKKDFKTLAGAFVVLRRMSYGQVVQRRALNKMSVLAQKGKAKSFAGEIAMASEAIAQFEFQHCVVDHNLEDNDGRKLNLSNPIDFAKLDPRVGQELEQFIADMNDFEEEEGEEGNSLAASEPV
jgi:hypothetical protein